MKYTSLELICTCGARLAPSGMRAGALETCLHCQARYQLDKSGLCWTRVVDQKRETSRSIHEWQKSTFGDAQTAVRLGTRTLEEMTELLVGLTDGTEKEKLREECADVTIVLVALCAKLGGDLWTEVEAKMHKNRGRKWKFDASGCGYHV